MNYNFIFSRLSWTRACPRGAPPQQADVVYRWSRILTLAEWRDWGRKWKSRRQETTDRISWWSCSGCRGLGQSHWSTRNQARGSIERWASYARFRWSSKLRKRIISCTFQYLRQLRVKLQHWEGVGYKSHLYQLHRPQTLSLQERQKLLIEVVIHDLYK